MCLNGAAAKGQCWQVLDTNLFGTSVKLAFYYNFLDAAWEIPNRNVYNPKEQPLGFTVKFSATALDVAPGTTGVPTVTFIEPAGIDAKLFPIYGGYINIIGSNDESLRVTCAENDTFKMTIEDTFTIDFDILWSSREISFDNKYFGSLQHYNLILDAYFDAPVQQYPRLPSSTWWPSGNFSHGSAIESGEYKILSRELRTYGDDHNISDWQIRVSPRIIVDKDKA
ncbi:peptidase [Colletotrichum abscissum]|uniref:Peptidase n=1 Tax=Colletotrichum abscissum TaxID=1671311 RepID=A0A9Q0B265_9PEZI|nr:peptidase [Colletotrichum abscissum]KAI3545245.1 peptidase [Colletotrichum abscissum]KAK1494991.1 peptidase [Colletotrichum abscissum]